MPHGAEVPHEEAEHAQHASHDPFDKRVALTMVLIAAALAGVKLLGHRAHTETLRLQIQTDVQHTQATDQWNFSQAKKMRQHLYESQADLLAALGKGDDARGKDWLDKSAKYKKEADDIQEKAKELVHDAEHLQHESEHMHHKSTFFDLGEMGIELGLVLCSVAILNKQRGFWYGGAGVALLGLVLAVIGMLA